MNKFDKDPLNMQERIIVSETIEDKDKEIERLTAELEQARAELREAQQLYQSTRAVLNETSTKQENELRQRAESAEAISLLKREGMVWVPEEPTREMLNAALNAVGQVSQMQRKAYKAMLKAAQDKDIKP